MHAFLQSVGWAYPISPKLTTIGQSGCDIIINNPSVDQQHAVIERSSVDGSVYIRDLCTKNGTFVNNLPVRNTTVKLKTGDQLRFACEPTIYEFQITHEVDQNTLTQRSQKVSTDVPHWTKVNAQPTRIFEKINPPQIVETTTISPKPVSMHPLDSWTLNESKRFYPTTLEANEQAAVGAHTQLGTLESKQQIDKNAPIQTNPVEITEKPAQNCDDKDQLIKKLQAEVARLAPLEAVNAQKDILVRHIQQQLSRLTTHRPCPNSPERVCTNQTEVDKTLLNEGTIQLAGTPQTDLNASNRTRPVSASSLLRSKPVVDVFDTTINRPSDPGSDEPVNTALFERIRRERQILSGLVTQLQRDLANKDTNLGRLNQELNTLRRQVNEKDMALNAAHAKFTKAQDTKKLQREREEHAKEIATIRQKYKAAELKAQALKEELEKIQQERTTMQTELEDSRRKEQQTQKAVDELKSQLVELARSERTAMLEKEEATCQYERLRNKIMRTVFAVLVKQNTTADNETEKNKCNKPDETNATEVLQEQITDTSNNAITSETDDNHIFDRLNALVEDYLKLQRKLVGVAKAAEEQDRRNQGLEKELDYFIDQLVEVQGHLNENPRVHSSVRLRNQLDLLTTYTPKSIQLRRLQDTLSQDWQAQLNTAQRIEDCIQEASGAIAASCADSSLSLISHSNDTVTSIRRLAEFGMAMHAKREELQREIQQANSFHEEELERTKELHRKEVQRRVEEAVEMINAEHETKLRQTINEEVRIVCERQEQLIAVKQAIIEELELKLRETRQTMAERQTAHESEVQLLRDQVAELRQFERDLNNQETACAELKEQLESAKKTIDKTREETEANCEERWKKEVESHREQAKQHARTICVMEERLVKLAKQAKDSKAEITRLKRQHAELQTEHKQLQLRLTEAQQKLTSVRRTPSANTGAQGRQNDSLTDHHHPVSGKQTDAIQCDVLALKGLLQERDNTIATLRADLDGARAQLSDLRGELSEAQKEEIECALDFGKKANAELVSTRARITQLNDMLVGVRKQLADKETELRNQAICAQELRSTLEKSEQRSEELSRLLDQERESHARHMDQLNSASKLTEELAAVGGECRGERHLEIIEKQREALSQLRQRLREHPGHGGISSLGEPNRQVSNLRREVAELRSQTMLSEILPVLRTSNHSHHGALEGGSLQTDTDSGLETSMMDRTSLRSAMDALHNSEECYLDLSRAIARLLDLDNLPGQRSLVHVPTEERQLIRRERVQAMELLSQRIAVLREQVQRKTDMLTNYEHDMGKLMQAEVTVDAKNEQMRQMVADLRSKETEIQLLRQSLDRTREALTNEQRMVSAVRKSKHTMPVQSVEPKAVNDRKKQPHCPIADPLAKEAKKVQEMNEKIKRKNYEIKVLKNELSDREKQHREAFDKLNQMKTAMGLADN